MSRSNLWSEDELVLSLALYFNLTFGQFHKGNDKIISLAELMGRTPGSIAMRLSNFAACDPYILNSGRHGLANGMSVCEPIWKKYAERKDVLFVEAARILEKYKCNKQLQGNLFSPLMRHKTQERLPASSDAPKVEQNRLLAISDAIFRQMILSNYNNKCAISGINMPELLVVNHIRPIINDDKSSWMEPENGICLSALYAAAFTKGLIGINRDYRVLVASQVRREMEPSLFQRHFKAVEGQKIITPVEHLPSKEALQYHLDTVFEKMAG